MALTTGSRPSAAASGAASIKDVPQVDEVRLAIRQRARQAAQTLGRAHPPSRQELERLATEILTQLGLPGEYLGFAMVCVDNAFWEPEYDAVPHDRRLLLLPKCLSDYDACAGHYDSVGLHCAGCGHCVIQGLKEQAEALGYQVIVAEGTSSVVMCVLEGRADAILGVACLDSLEKSFERIADLGIPHQAVPLLTDGCRDTTAEVDLIRDLITQTGDAGPGVEHSYLPLLRETHGIFEVESLCDLLAPHQALSPAGGADREAFRATDRVAMDWLATGGKRFRPFIIAAAYAVGKHGLRALQPGEHIPDLLPRHVRSMAVAIEAFHKASLAHDDIEDDDPVRYGKPTLHRVHGVPAAINVGDYLVGLGYRLIAAQTDELGAECVADILGRLSLAHLQLCRGQGADLAWHGSDGEDLRPIDALRIGALKTAPAFEVALYTGLRAAGVAIDQQVLHQFSTYIGEGYQVLNDLTDWEEDGTNKAKPGADGMSSRPTVLRAFALEAGGADRLQRILSAAEHTEASATGTTDIREFYSELGVFAKAETLYARLRGRALELADSIGDEPLQELLRFLVRNVLRRRDRQARGGAR